MKFEIVAVAATVTEANDLASRELLQEQFTALELRARCYKFCPRARE